MKTINIKNISLLAIISLFITISCQDTDDNFKSYLEKGETIYTNKIDSLTSYSGYNRIKLEGYITNAFNVSDIVINWTQNNEKKEKITPYTKKLNTDMISIIIPNLKEGTYEFSIHSRDALGNKSIAERIFATAYGDTYKKGLTPRGVSEVTFGDTDTSLNIDFSVGNEFQRNTDVKYTTNEGNEKIVTLPVNETHLQLNDINLDKPITYRTYYVPTLAKEIKNQKVETTIDLFETVWKDISIPEERALAKATWTVSDFSSEEKTGEGPNNGMAKFVFDNNLDSFWHSQWQGNYAVYPHFFVIDMGKSAKVISFEIARRKDNDNFPSKLKFEVSEDNVNWSGQEFTASQNTNSMQKFKLDTPITGRYFKITGLEDAAHGNNRHMCVSEVTIYGKYQ